MFLGAEMVMVEVEEDEAAGRVGEWLRGGGGVKLVTVIINSKGS